MGHQNHVIKKQVLQIDIASAGKAKAAQNELSRIYRYKLQNLIDEILEAANVGDTVLRFDRLVLTCRYSQVDDLEVALVKAVREQLPRLLKSKPQAAEEAPQKTDRNISLLDLLQHFLLKGSLPWWADDSESSLDQWIQQLLQEKPALLLQQLQGLATNQSAMARLNFQLSAAVKKQLLQWILKKEEAHVQQNIQYLQNAWHKKGKALLNSNISFLLEQSLLAYALQHGDREFHPDKLITILWGFLPAHLSSQKEQIALLFIQSAEDAPQALSWSNAFRSVLSSPQHKAVESNFSSASKLADFQQLQCFIEKGYWPGPTNQTPFEMDVWLINFCRQHQKSARQQIPALIAEEKYFQRFVQSVSTTTLELLTAELLFDVSREKVNFIPDLLEVLQHLFQGKHSRDSFQRQLEIALLRYLVFHQPMQLQAQSVLAFLLKEMARFIPVDLEILKVKTATKAQELNQSQLFKSGLMVLLEPFTIKSKAQTQKDASEYSEQEILWHFLKTGRFPQGVLDFNLNKLEVIFHQLLQKASPDFIEKLRHSLSAPNQPDRFQKQFSKTLIQKVTLLFQGSMKEKVALLQKDLQVLFQHLFGSQHGATAIAQCLDIALLRYFVRHRQTQLQATHLLFFILQQFSRFVPIALDDLILKTQNAASQLARQQNFKSPLPDLLLQLEVSTANDPAKNPSAYSDEALLFFFIKTGHLPAEKMDLSLDELSATFYALLENPRPGLAQQLRQLLSTPHHLERFQQQFSIELTTKVSVLLQGLLSANVQKYQEDLQSVFLELYQGQHHQQAIERHLTFSLLRYFVLHQPTVLQPLSLLTFLLESFARFVPIDYTTLVATGKETAEQLDRRMPFKSPVVGLLAQLYKELTHQSNSSVSTLPEEMNFWRFLEEGILPEGRNTEIDLEKYFKQILKKNDSAFLHRLRQSLSNTETMDRLTSWFSPELLALVSNGLQGKLQNKIKNYREDLLGIFYPICRGKYSEQDLAQHLELSILQFFIYGQHTPFQPLRLIAFLLEAFARFIPLNPTSLLNQVNVIAQDLDNQRSFKSPVVALLSQLKKEKNDSQDHLQITENIDSALFYFLENGHWSQQTNASNVQHPVALLNRILEKADTKFIQKLQQSLANPRHLENFQKVFSTLGIAKVATLFQGTLHTKITAFREDLQLVFGHLYQSQFGAAAIEQQIQLSLLRYFVKPPQQQFQASVLLLFMLKEFARFVPVDFEALKQSVATSIQQLDQTQSFKSPILALSEQWKKEKDNTALTSEYHSEENDLFYFLENGHWSQQTNVSNVQHPAALLNRVLEKADTNFIQKLQQSLANPHHLENFQKVFSTLGIAKVATLFQGTLHTKITAFREDLQLVFGHLYQRQFGAAAIEQQIQLSLLRYFVKPPQQQFQASVLLLFVLKEFARFVPVDFESLKQRVATSIQQLDQTQSFKSPILALSEQWKKEKDNTALTSEYHSEENDLFYFLENGHWSQQTNVSNVQHPAALLNRVLEKADTNFIQKLQQSLANPRHLENFQKVFSTLGIAKVATLFQGTLHTKITAFREDLQLVFGHLYQRQFGAAAIEQQIQLSLLRYFVKPPQQQFQASVLLLFVLKEFARFVPVDFESLKQTAATSIQQLDQIQSFKSPILVLSEQWIATPGVITQRVQLSDDKTEILFYFLENGKIPEGHSVFPQSERVSFLQALLEKRTPTFVQQLRQVLHSKKAVDHLFQHFPDKTIACITEIFLGTFANRVQHYHQDLQTIFHSLYQAQHSIATIDRQLTTSLLRYAIALPKKQLNPLELMSTLLDDFAQFVSVDAVELKTITQEKAQQLDRQIRFKSPVVDLLNHGISAGQKTTSKIITPEPKPEVSAVKKETGDEGKFDRECQRLSSFSEKATPLVDALWFLLKCEKQSWWLDSDIDLEQIVETLSVQHPDILKQQLSLVWEVPEWSQRLLGALSVSGIQHLAKTITGNSDTLILDYTELVWLHLATGTTADWQQLIPSRIHLLQRIFKESLHQASFSAAAFINACSQNLAVLLNTSPKKLVSILQESAATLVPQSGVGLSQLYALLTEASEHFQEENTSAITVQSMEVIEEVSFLMEEMDWQQARKRTTLEEFEILRYFLYFGSFRPDYPVYKQEAFEQLLLGLMTQYPVAAKKLLKQLFRRPTAIERLVTHFSEKVIQQFLQLFFSGQQKQLQSDWKTLVFLFKKLAPEKRKGDWMRLLQSQLMQYAAVVKNAQVTLEDYLPKVVAALAQRSGQKREVLIKNLQQEIRESTRAISQPMREAILHWKEAKKQHLNKPKNIWEKMAEESIQLEDAVYIHNAGLAIISPFLPRYFKMLDMLEDGIFKDEEAAIRAVHLLQYLVTGLSETAEHHLVFNKILCGLPLETPVPLGIEMSELEIETSASMLEAIIQNWGKLNSTTVDGLRGGFLVRDAKITEAEKYWAIDVENKAYDVLLDTLPWSISIIKHPWIPKRIQINWR